MRIRELIPWRSRESNQLSHSRGGDPFAAFETEMHRLFNEFLGGLQLSSADRSGLAESTAVPKIDVAETDEAVHVTAELPGMKEDDVEVTLSDGHLLIRGEKKAEHEQKHENYYRIERSYGSFHRSIPLPAEVDEQKVEASFKNGVLDIVLPKVAGSTSGKKIPVRRLN